MTARAQPLVGREYELEVLERLRAEAREGTPRFAQVTGEPGIGKTSLLTELGRRADADGWLVLSGRSSELEQELPFGLVIDAFDAYLASLDPQAFDRIARDELDELARLFPSLRSLVPEPVHPTTAAERFRVHRAVVEMIERLGARQPVLLLLDDLHWADGASIEQAGYVLRRPPDAAVMIVGSFRTGQADPALVAAVEAAAREGYVEHLALGPLGADEAEVLLGTAPEKDRIYEASGGNPFYLLQLARGGTDGRRAIGGPRPGEGGVPAAVASSIASELAALSADASKLAVAAAVAGDPFEVDLAAGIAQVADAEALESLDELVACDLVRPTAVPRTFQFRHPLVRSAVYETSSPGSRLAAHELAARALAARGAPATERAHHVEQAARQGDAEAIAVLRAAGEEAAGRAPRTAARWFAAALRRLPADGPVDERLSLLMALAGAQATIGRLEESHAAAAECIQLASDDGPVSRVQAIAVCASVEQLLGRHGAAHQRLVTALDELPDPASADAAALMVNLAVDSFFGMEFEQMHEWGRRAIEVAGGLDDKGVAAAATAITAFAASCVGPVSDANRHREEATVLVDALSDDEVAKRLDAISWLSAAEFYLEQYDAGTRHAERGLGIARATGQGDFVPTLVQALGNLLLLTGRPVEAGEVLDESVDAARLTDNAIGLAWSLLNRCFAAIAEGDIGTAMAVGEEAFALTEDLEDSIVGAWAGGVYSAALLESGQAARGAEIIVSRAGGDEAPLIPGAWRANWLGWLTRCFLGAGRIEDAERTAGLTRARAREFPLHLAISAADRAEAGVALARGEATHAAELALSSAEHADEAGAPIEAAWARTLAGQALAQAGEREAAVAELERAATQFDACRAVRYRDRAERELGKLGRRVHRRSRPGKTGGEGIESLTERELEVARLVVDRRTNPEIAAELFLSVKTVETHMRNIFRKLDVSSRVEVARTVEAAGAPRT